MNSNNSSLGVQLREIWKQLGAAQRVSVALATLVVLGGLISLVLWSGRASYGLLYGRLSEAESAKVIAALDDAKVPYKVSGGGSILVPEDKVHVMRMQLAGRGIPRGEGVGYEIFDKPNFGMSDFVQRANYLRALQGELGRTIGQMDEVESARVMVVLPENRLLLDKDKHPTASVFLRVRGNGSLQAQSINAIRFLVANAVEGLRPNYVTVVDSLGNLLSENTENDSLIGLSSTQLAARRNLEQYLSKKAESMLEKVLGPGQAIVRVSAEINFDTITRTEEKFDPDGQVIKTQTKNEENSDTAAPQISQAAGVVPNVSVETNTQPTVATTTSSNTRTKKNTGTTEYEISKTVSNIMQAAGGVKRVSAAVTIASRSEGIGAARKTVPRSTEEIEKLRRIVQSSLGIQPGENGQGDQIILEELPFNDTFTTELNRQFESDQMRDFYWVVGRKVGVGLLVLVALFVFVRLYRRTPPDEINLGIPLRQLKAGRLGMDSPRLDLANDDAQGVVTVDVLNQLIKENPGNMTQAIRGWLARGKSEKQP
jgi:flagellar M-ring protein FliF